MRILQVGPPGITSQALEPEDLSEFTLSGEDYPELEPVEEAASEGAAEDPVEEETREGLARVISLIQAQRRSNRRTDPRVRASDRYIQVRDFHIHEAMVGQRVSRKI